MPAASATFDRYAKLIALHLTAPSRSKLDHVFGASDTFLAPMIPAQIPAPFAGQSDLLGPIQPKGQPGISVVTCSMNRTENLIKAMPSWLANPEISEIIVVDWSSKLPVAADLRRANITDPRIRVLRVDGEPRWILSYAFNAGFRAAACDTILKVDADIVLSPDFFRRNHVVDGSFIAGNWRKAAEGQAHVNGFFFVPRSALHLVGGFNEHITTYGWDDDDIYDRMTLMGIRRRDVADGTIFHLDHDDEDRLGVAGSASDTVTVRKALTSGTKYLIRCNRYLAMVMPYWDQNSVALPMRIGSRTANSITVRRDGWEPSRVPSHILAAGQAHAISELLSWRLGRRVLELDQARVALLLDRADAEVSRIDVEVAIAAPDRVIRGSGHYLVLDTGAAVLTAPGAKDKLAPPLTRLIAAAKQQGLTPVLRAPLTELPEDAPDCLRSIPLIPSWETIGDVVQTTAAALLSSSAPTTGHLCLSISADTLSHIALAAPVHAVPPKRLFIDAQHGLGNRLRAIGSAAAIAAASGRELVIIWEADHHCDCRFADLFTYDGPVIEQRFAEDARKTGADIYNYMPNEEGAEKDALIRAESGQDIYARSAFVLNSPHSTWTTENSFLKSLIPIPQIANLVASVRNPNDLSAHIRMEAGAGLDHNTYDRPENWRPEDHEKIHEWRAKSHFTHFIRRIDALIADGRAERIFLAADLPTTYAEFQDRYGDRLAWLPRSLYDRSAAQLHYAMADAILLSRAPLLLGSTWSSFSELAMRLAPGKITIEMSGRDF